MCAARVVSATDCPYPQRSAKPSLPTCAGGDRIAPVVAYSYAPEPRFAAFRGACGVGSIVRHSLQRAGIQATTSGAHQFRHGLATEMLHRGASLSEIGELLGHRHPPTTKIYTKVDIKALRTLALPWPGAMNTLRQAVQEYLSLRRSLGFKLQDAGK